MIKHQWSNRQRVAESCPTLWDPTGCSPPGSSVHRVFPGKNIGVGCHFLSQGNLPDPGIKPMSPVLAGRFFTTEPHGKASFYQWFTPKGGSVKQLWWGNARIKRGIRYPWNSNLILVKNITHSQLYTQIWNCFFENVSVWGDNSLIWRL